MSQKAMKVVVELHLRAVSCPGVHLPAKDDIYLSVCLMNQYRKSECLPAVFPLLFREKMRFEKIFKYANDPAAVAEILQCETAKVELIQLIPPVGEILASVEEDVRSFLFPEPKLVPSFSGVDREVLMTRDTTFPGISPRLEFSTRTTISECSESDSHLSVPVRVVTRKRSKKSRQGRASPQRLRSSTPWGQRGHWGREWAPKAARSRSLSPYTAHLLEGSHDNARRLAQLRLGSQSPESSRTDSTPEFVCQHRKDSWPGDGQSCSSQLSPVRLRTTRCRSPSPRRPRSPPRVVADASGGITRSRSNGWDPEDDSLSFDTDDLLDYAAELGQRHSLSDSAGSPSPAALWCSYRESPRQNGSLLRSQNVWEEVQERVRGLLTSPKAVHRLTHGATDAEIDEVLARRSISPHSYLPREGT